MPSREKYLNYQAGLWIRIRILAQSGTRVIESGSNADPDPRAIK
jgi:hypothetical protein